MIFYIHPVFCLYVLQCGLYCTNSPKILIILQIAEQANWLGQNAFWLGLAYPPTSFYGRSWLTLFFIKISSMRNTIAENAYLVRPASVCCELCNIDLISIKYKQEKNLEKNNCNASCVKSEISQRRKNWSTIAQKHLTVDHNENSKWMKKLQVSCACASEYDNKYDNHTLENICVPRLNGTVLRYTNWYQIDI